MRFSPRQFPFACAASALLILLSGIRVEGQSQNRSQEPQCKPVEPTQYAWERLNYYELLGLQDERGGKGRGKKKKKKKRNAPSSGKNEEGRVIGPKEIRKAYRKQAQKYHPDKQASRRKSIDKNGRNNKSSSSSSEAISVEESNARFSKIAEAYEFLLDDAKRADYDLFLEYCQNTEIVKDDEAHEGRLSTVIKKRFRGLFDDLVGSRDPLKVFKDVFFGGDDDDRDAYFDPNDPFSHLRYESNPQRHPNHQQYHADEEPYDPQEDPVRVFDVKQYMYDPITGENVVRVLQTEEFAPSSSSRQEEAVRNSTRGAGNSTLSSSFYYRVIAQDFKEGYDPYSAEQVYAPITEPYLQEDGFRTTSASRDHTAQSSSASMESILHPWQILTPFSPPMVSPNKRYVAGLSPDCELLVMINPDRLIDEDHRPPEVLWSTQRPYGNNGQVAEHCFAMLKGAHLVVTVGQNPQESSHQQPNNNRILWHSDGRSDENDSRHGYYEYEDEFGFWHKRQRSYLAQLENDGSLTVYSVWNVPEDLMEGKDHRQRQRYSSVEQPFPRAKVLSAHVARAATRAAKDFWHGRIQTKHEYDHLYSTSRSLTYKRCVSSTYGVHLPPGVGCSRVSRRLHQLAIEASLALRKWVFQINAFTDAWLDLIYEEDDIFYFLKENVWRNTLGSKVAGSSARWIRKVLDDLKQLSPSSK